MSTKPGVQKPHWKAPALDEGLLHRIGLRSPLRWFALQSFLQELPGKGSPETAVPLTSTVQQPHRPWPQLSRAPYRPNDSLQHLDQGLVRLRLAASTASPFRRN